MVKIKRLAQSSAFRGAILGLYLCLYLLSGLRTELRFIEARPLSVYLLDDFKFYERALNDALQGRNPYALRAIGPGYLYPPPALLVIEVFSHLQPFLLKAILYSLANAAILVAMVYAIGRSYGYSTRQFWFWYPLCLGFAPFLELVHVGQINMITVFGLLVLWLWEVKAPALGGLGLGLAVITKVTPLLFLGYLVANRRFKTVAFAVGAVILLVGLSIWRYGPGPILTYPDVFLWLTRQFPLDLNTQSLVARLQVPDPVQFQQTLATLPGFLAQPVGAVAGFFASDYRTVQTLLTLYVLLALLASGLFTLFGRQPREPLFIVTTLGMMLSPNVMWYHHYVFILLPLLIWMGWQRLDWRVVTWCLLGLLVVQFDRWYPTYGLLIHAFGHATLLMILFWQARDFLQRRRKTAGAPQPVIRVSPSQEPPTSKAG